MTTLMTTLTMTRQPALFALVVTVLILPFSGVEAQTPARPYSPCVGRTFPTRVFFGDTHLHTRLSLDAYGDGNTKNGPSEAYRWAKGEIVAGDDGVPTRISRPLDFLMVADHGEYMGVVPALAEGNEMLRATEAGGRWGRMVDKGKLTSEAIWDAMKRKEVYATTGPRMVVRMFGGFDFTEADALSHDLAAIGYEKGVPMGGDLTDAPAGRSPTFLISAAKDPDGANLDRVQVVKGWLSADGQLHESVYDVAVSDRRTIANGRATTDVGSTVDLATATYSNSIGDPLLTTWWSDPGFDPEVSSFYYVRVIEIPTPRWPVFDEVRFGIEMDPGVTRVLQERAYTSPIWYTW